MTDQTDHARAPGRVQQHKKAEVSERERRVQLESWAADWKSWTAGWKSWTAVEWEKEREKRNLRW